jgi:hypothetical protein
MSVEGFWNMHGHRHAARSDHVWYQRSDEVLARVDKLLLAKRGLQAVNVPCLNWSASDSGGPDVVDIVTTSKREGSEVHSCRSACTFCVDPAYKTSVTLMTSLQVGLQAKPADRSRSSVGGTGEAGADA